MKAEYLEHMGDDLSVVNAARVSFEKESAAFSDSDARLINYLARHNHWTPFAHTAIKLRMSAPVPIRTQCFKHKAGFVENEESRRYISSKPEIYVPEFWRMASEDKKQGSGEVHQYSDYWSDRYAVITKDLIYEYLDMIDDGVCPEQARFVLPQGTIVNWIWTGNLASFARFVKQRTDPHSQNEVRQLAKTVGDIIAPLFPVSWAALVD